MFDTIPHAHFPFRDSPWIPHFRDAARSNGRAAAAYDLHAQRQSDRTLVQYLIGTPPGSNPEEGPPGWRVQPQGGGRSPPLPSLSQYLAAFQRPGATGYTPPDRSNLFAPTGGEY